MAIAQPRSLAYKPDQGLNRATSSSATSTEMKFNNKTGKWEVVTSVNTSAPALVPWYYSNLKNAKNKTLTPSSPTPTQVDSKTQAEKEYIETEFNTLVGDLSMTPTKKSILIEVNNTVTILGVGKYLSGNYFVSSVKRSINKDSGYSQSLTVIKNGFGDSLKQPAKSSAETKPREEVVEKTTAPIKVGDKVKIVGDKAVYSNAHEGVKVPDWVKQKTLTVKQLSSDGSRALLMPITSWTYIKYIQKV